MTSEPETQNPPKKEIKILRCVQENAKGTVKWYNLKNLYGFIHLDDVDKDIFVHKSAITAFTSFPSLKIGEPVEFKIVETTQGIEASEVTGPGGAKVKGFRYNNGFRRGANRDANGEVDKTKTNGDDEQQNKKRTRTRVGKSTSGNKTDEYHDVNGGDQKQRDDGFVNQFNNMSIGSARKTRGGTEGGRGGARRSQNGVKSVRAGGRGAASGGWSTRGGGRGGAPRGNGRPKEGGDN